MPIPAHRRAEDPERRIESDLAVTAHLRAMQVEKMRQRVGPAADEDEPDDGGKAAPSPATKDPRASTMAAEARVMKMVDGGFRPAYDVQFAAATKSGAVAGVAVHGIGSDMGRMEPMSEALGAA